MYQNLQIYIGKRFKTHREEYKWTQQDLATVMEVKQNTVSMIEGGKRPITGQEVQNAQQYMAKSISDLEPKIKEVVDGIKDLFLLQEDWIHQQIRDEVILGDIENRYEFAQTQLEKGEKSVFLETWHINYW